MRDLVIADRFAPEAERMRACFDARCDDLAAPERFVWDYFHVPGQYTHLRTPAYHYFPTELYDAFHQRLVAWGRRYLGCHDVSPPWLSCYVDGCGQELHGDLPHGQWAFVYSLTRWQKRTFRGGETMLLRDDVLDYWSDFVSARGLETPDLWREIEPQFNRLTVFDPRVPHGVRTVRGSHDPKEGRLVIHGWFVQPRPFISGPLRRNDLKRALVGLEKALSAVAATAPPVAGLFSLKLSIAASGRVTAVRLLSDTTRSRSSEEPARKKLVRAAVRATAALRFPKRSGSSEVTLPLIFER